MIDADAFYRAKASDISSQIFDDEAVIINFASNVYYTLTGAGIPVWRALAEGCSANGAAGRVAIQYGIAVTQALADIEALFVELEREGLVMEGAGPVVPGADGNSNGAPGTYEPPKLTAYRDMADILALDPPLPELRPLTGA